jgi:hypothetical protein
LNEIIEDIGKANIALHNKGEREGTRKSQKETTTEREKETKVKTPSTYHKLPKELP